MQIDMLSKIKGNGQTNQLTLNEVIEKNEKNKMDKESGHHFCVENQALYMGSVISANAKAGAYPEKEKNEEVSIMEKAKAKLSLQELNHADFILKGITTQDVSILEKEGYNLEDEQSQTMVTVVDKIKFAMLEGGNTEAASGLSSNQIEQMTGNRGIAQNLIQEMEKVDLPITQEFVEEVDQAYTMMDNLKPIGKETASYLLKNAQLPTIANVYKAEFAVVNQVEKVDSKLPQIQSMTTENSQEQALVVKALDQFQIEKTSDAISTGTWMIAHDIPVTQENMTYMLTLLNESALPTTPQKKVEVMVDAAISGRKPQDGILIKDLSDYRKLCEIREKLNLEGHRLNMTASGSLALLKKGIQIDIQPIEESIKALKIIEQQMEEKLYLANGLETQQVQMDAKQALTVVEELEKMPAFVLGIQLEKIWTLDELHQAGQQELQKIDPGKIDPGKIDPEKLGQAVQSYEMLMTSPRQEYGDNIQKAFQNVDAILQDLALEVTPANQRAVRILAYNQQELKPENIVAMKQTDQSVNAILDQLTPKKVMSMIREGYNPIQVPLDELEQKLQQMEIEVPETDHPKYAEFLWKLDQQKSITQEEREAFIGIYRLVRQVEKTDGAAIGALIGTGETLTMKNLLTQVRSGKSRGLDRTVNENTGERQSVVQEELSITQQIEQVYQIQCLKQAGKELKPSVFMDNYKNENFLEMTPEQLLAAMEKIPDEQTKEYQKFKLEQYQSQLQNNQTNEKQIINILKQFDLPDSQINVQAIGQMLQNRNKLFKDLLAPQNTISSKDLDTIKEDLLKNFAEAVKTPEEMAKAQLNLAETAEHVMDNMMEAPDLSYENYKQMQLFTRQIQIQQALGKKEYYEIPVLVGDTLTNVSLKIVRGEKEKGLIGIGFETESLGKVSVEMQVTSTGVKGKLEAEKKEALDGFEQVAKEMDKTIAQILGLEELQLIKTDKVDLGLVINQSEVPTENSTEKQTETVTTQQLYQLAKSFLSYLSKVK